MGTFQRLFFRSSDSRWLNIKKTDMWIWIRWIYIFYCLGQICLFLVFIFFSLCRTQCFSAVATVWAVKGWLIWPTHSSTTAVQRTTEWEPSSSWMLPVTRSQNKIIDAHIKCHCTKCIFLLWFSCCLTWSIYVITERLCVSDWPYLGHIQCIALLYDELQIRNVHVVLMINSWVTLQPLWQLY